MSGRFHSADKVRCPRCHKTWDPRSGDPFHNGENGFICPACEREFTVLVELLPEFTSPESDTSPFELAVSAGVDSGFRGKLRS